MFYALGALLAGPDVVNKGPFPVFILVHKHKQRTSSPLAFYVGRSLAIVVLLKFIYSNKAAKFCEISNLLLSVCTVDNSEVEISQNVLAFSE